VAREPHDLQHGLPCLSVMVTKDWVNLVNPSENGVGSIKWKSRNIGQSGKYRW